MVYCCVPYCSSDHKKSKNMSFHEFPCEETRKERWIKNISRKAEIEDRLKRNVLTLKRSILWGLSDFCISVFKRDRPSTFNMSISSGPIYCIPEEEENQSDCSSDDKSLTSSTQRRPLNYSLSNSESKDKFSFRTGSAFTSNLSSTQTVEEEGIRHKQFENKMSTMDIKSRISVSLIDFSEDIHLTSSDSGSLGVDKPLPYIDTTSSETNKETAIVRYQVFEDYNSHSNQYSCYEKLLQPHVDFHSVSHEDISQSEDTSDHQESSSNQNSENFLFIDLNKQEKCRSTEDLKIPSQLPSKSRQRSGSVQWLQSAFHSVNQRCKNLVEPRRPSDIVEERMRKSNEELEMNEPQYEVLKMGQNSTGSGRRYSENIIGKQKKFNFATGFGHLKELWKERNVGVKRQEEKDTDQTRPDVCPLFNFPKNYDEDELILDALRQAMRKCTVVDPTARPSSSVVLEQLSKIMK